MSDPRTIDFPSDWGTADPVDHRAGTLDGGLYVFGVLLDDGANLFALIYRGGHRFVRTAYQIDWGVEERYGPPPRRRDLARVNAAWRGLVDEIIAAGKAADADMAAQGLPPARETARAWRRLQEEGS